MRFARSSRKARCTRPCIDSRRPVRSPPSWEKESQGRRGPRGRIYRLTTKGHRKLAQGRGEWQTFVATLGGILLDAPA